MATDTDQLLTPLQVRTLLGVGRTTVHDWTVRGLLTAETTPTGRRFYPASQPLIAARLRRQR